MTSEIRDKVISIIAEQALLDVESVSEANTLEELGVDSLALVESVYAIEEAFDINIPLNANTPNDGEFDISSVGSIITSIERLINIRAG